MLYSESTTAHDLMEQTQLAVPPVVGRCDWLELAARQFQAIGRLPDGWDGDTASRPDAASLGTAWDLLVALCSVSEIPRPHVNPTRAGGVQFEWETADQYFEIEVLPNGPTSFFFRDDQCGTEESGEIVGDQPLDRIVGYIRRAGISGINL